MIGNFIVGQYLVEPQTHRVYAEKGSGEPRSLEPKSMQILLRLAAQAPNVVSKNDLIDQVWGNMVVGDDVLSNAIWQLRTALSDDARKPQYIETIRGKGYRMMQSPKAVDSASIPSSNSIKVLLQESTNELSEKPAEVLVNSSKQTIEGNWKNNLGDVPNTEGSNNPICVATSLQDGGGRHDSSDAVVADTSRSRHSVLSFHAIPMTVILVMTAIVGVGWLSSGSDSAFGAVANDRTSSPFMSPDLSVDSQKQSAIEHVETARRLLDEANNQHMVGRAKRHALLAQELDPSSAKADHILGEIYTLHEWNWCGAQQVMHRVLNMNPSSQAYAHHAWLMTVVGKHDDAKVSLARSRAANDHDLETGVLGLRIDALMQRYDEMEMHAEKLLESHPMDKKIIKQMELMAIEQAKTIDEIESVKNKYARNKYAAKIAYNHAKSGRNTQEARETLDRLIKNNGSPYQIAMIQAALGDHDAAIKQLEEGIAMHYVTMPRINVDPRFDSLRQTEAFQVLLAKMNLKDLDCRVESLTAIAN